MGRGILPAQGINRSTAVSGDGQEGRKTPEGGRIHLLSESVINQIAAGEVVERPASVVKELLENAVDAGAGQITVTVADGGRESICVLDDGCGMEEEDLLLAVERHATSKLNDAADLARIDTLGFRGEALAAIASVSRFELVSCGGEGRGGMRLTMEGGRETSRGRIGFPRGTKVTVEELFSNTPARRKFLRSATTEFQHIQSSLLQLALAQPRLHLRLIHNRRTVQDLPGCPTLADRAYQVFGREMSQGLIPVEGREAGFAFSGLVSLPEAARASRRWQHLFLNGRPIRNPGVQHAVYQAYRTLLMKGRHPAYVLDLTMAPEEVDVNVHPAKTEVRMRNPQVIHAALARGLHTTLRTLVRGRAFGTESEAPAPTGDGRGFDQGVRAAFPLSHSGTVGDGATNRIGAGAGAPGEASRPLGTGFLNSEIPNTGGFNTGGFNTGAFNTEVLNAGALKAETLNTETEGELFHIQPLVSPSAGAPARDPLLVKSGMHVLGQFHGTYILAQAEERLLLVDQHAAHERILFEQYRLQFYDGRPKGERFLIPLTLELSPQNALLLEQYLPQWAKMGFEIEHFGRGGYVVRQVPAMLAGKDVPALILEVLDDLALFGKSGRLEEVLNEIMERVACHSAIRAGDILSREEMADLLAQLEALDIHLYCPHGRPVWVEFPLQELEKRFKRIV